MTSKIKYKIDADPVRISALVDPETAARFAARFPSRGSRTVYLRRVIAQVAGQAVPATVNANGPAAASDSTDAARAEITSLRLYPDQMDRIREAAAVVGMKPSQWMRAVIEARLAEGGLHLPGDDRVALNTAARAVRRIGNNHNQLTQAARRAAVNGKPFDVHQSVLDELSALLSDLRSKFDAVVMSRRRYWKGGRDE